MCVFLSLSGCVCVWARSMRVQRTIFMVVDHVSNNNTMGKIMGCITCVESNDSQMESNMICQCWTHSGGIHVWYAIFGMLAIWRVLAWWMVEPVSLEINFYGMCIKICLLHNTDTLNVHKDTSNTKQSPKLNQRKLFSFNKDQIWLR